MWSRDMRVSHDFSTVRQTRSQSPQVNAKPWAWAEGVLRTMLCPNPDVVILFKSLNPICGAHLGRCRLCVAPCLRLGPVIDRRGWPGRRLWALRPFGTRAAATIKETVSERRCRKLVGGRFLREVSQSAHKVLPSPTGWAGMVVMARMTAQNKVLTKVGMLVLGWCIHYTHASSANAADSAEGLGRCGFRQVWV